jgi:hypothetical protein
LSAQPGAPGLIAAAWYPSVLAPFFVGRTIELNQQLPDGLWPWATANHVVFYANQRQRGLPNAQIERYFAGQPAEFSARLAGIEYAWAYAGPIVPAGPLPPAVQPLDATFEGQLRLIGWEPPLPSTDNGAALRLPVHGLRSTVSGLRLYWETLQPPAPDLSVFIGLRDGEGRLWGRHDQPPVDGFLPLDRWLPGMRVRDAQMAEPFPGTPPGTYALEVALFSPTLGRNLAVTAPDGTALGDRLRLGTLVIGPGPVAANAQEIAMGQRLDRRLGEITLLGVTVGGDEMADGAAWPLTLWWQAAATTRPAYRAGLILTGVDGRTWQRAVRRSVGGAYPSDQWPSHAIIRDAWDALLPPGVPAGIYQAEIVLYDPVGSEVGRAAVGSVGVRGRSHTTEVPTLPTRVDANFGGKATLLGGDLADASGRPAPRWQPGAAYTVTLYWQPTTEWELEYIGFVHLLDGAGAVVAQCDQVPAGGQAPTTGWLPGEVVADRYGISVPPGLPAGEYTIEAGLYRPGTFERMPILDRNGKPVADRVILGAVAVEGMP